MIGLGDGSGDRAALELVGAWLVLDQHGHRDLGVRDRARKRRTRSRCSAHPVWAVPVLPATCTPGIRAATPVPLGLFTTESIRLVTLSAVPAEVAVSQGFGL